MPDEIARLQYELNQWQVTSHILSGQLLQSWDMPLNLRMLVTDHITALTQVLEPSEESRQLTLLATSTVLSARYVHDQETDIEKALALDCYNTLLINIHNFDFLDKLGSIWNSSRLQNDLLALVRS